ncbi:MAG: DUF2357 domain-containing protein [Candidatus Auribacterota bacterium]|jgi:hypothetical protein|nr:DUF2357 domain-containing protein [Candidatus Auribacterota bacterium]
MNNALYYIKYPWLIMDISSCEIIDCSQKKLTYYGKSFVVADENVAKMLEKGNVHFSGSLNSKYIYELSYDLSNLSKSFSNASYQFNFHNIYQKDTEDSEELKNVFLIWSQFFDDLIDIKKDIEIGEYDATAISWEDIEKRLGELNKEKSQPQMTIIVKIALELHKTLSHTVRSMRKYLRRVRQKEPINRVQEMDTQCLRWLAQQPGETIFEKIGNVQECMSVIRTEVYDTLENRMLRDFVWRSRKESTRYLKHWKHMQSIKRVRSVSIYHALCNNLFEEFIKKNISQPDKMINANYVLLNDIRYKKIWYWYNKLLRKEKQEDLLWNWQGRLWADVIKILVGVSLHRLQIEKKDIEISVLLDSQCCVTSEQIRGCRILGESLPGPFQVKKRDNNQVCKNLVIEIVDGEKASKHHYSDLMIGLGGCFYFVVHIIKEPKNQVCIIPIWCLHLILRKEKLQRKELDDMLVSLRGVFKKMEKQDIFYKGVIFLNTQDDKMDPLELSSDIFVLEVPASPNCWIDIIHEIQVFLSFIIEECYER